MKIIDAFWEKRNLGVDTVEFELDGSESADYLKKQITENEKTYNVVKIPSGNLKLYSLMQEMGYSFNEELLNIKHDLKEIPATRVQKRIIDSVSYSEMNSEDRDILFSEIRKGMFTTDRIALNPNFGIKMANERYIGWIKDELERGTRLFKLLYKDSSIGFFVFKALGDGVYFPFLAGMYEDYFKSGLGINIVVKPIEEAISQGGKQISTYVSSNNSASLSANLAFGFRIAGISAVFSKNK